MGAAAHRDAGCGGGASRHEATRVGDAVRLEDRARVLRAGRLLVHDDARRGAGRSAADHELEARDHQDALRRHRERHLASRRRGRACRTRCLRAGSPRPPRDQRDEIARALRLERGAADGARRDGDASRATNVDVASTDLMRSLLGFLRPRR